MRETMKALVKNGSGVCVARLPCPAMESDHDVIVRVELAGLCRTDLYVVEGRIATSGPLILGHEFAGVVAEVGASVEKVAPGNKVTVNPVIPCGTCRRCLNGQRLRCHRYKFMGIDRDGCYAGFVRVDEASAFALPDSVSFTAAAYAEPVAAALAVLKTGIKPEDKGVVFGRNRFSQLLAGILRAHDFTDVAIHDPVTEADVEADAFDFVVETFLNTDVLSAMIAAVRPGGRLILKSRQHEAVSLSLSEAIRKEPLVHVVNYGPFEEAVALLSSGRVDVEALVDGVYRLEDFAAVVERSRQSEALKPFFAPWES